MVFRRAVQQNIHVCADMDVAQLQRAGEGKNKRDVFARGGFLADDFDFCGWPRRNAAGQRRIGVDVEFEEMEEGVVNHGDCAVDFAFFTVVELEGSACFVAGRKGFPFNLVLFVFEVFACFSAAC